MPLVLGAALLQPTGLLVALAEYGSGGDAQVAALVTSATFGLQYAAAFLALRATTLGWVCIAFASLFTGVLGDMINLDADLIGMTLGAGWLGVGVQAFRSRHASISGHLLLFGCWAFLAGLFDIVQRSAFEAVFVVAACGFVYLGVWLRSRALNFGGAAAILAYTGYFTGQHFADSVGWPVALMVTGLLMIGIGALALRIDRKYLRSAD